MPKNSIEALLSNNAAFAAYNGFLYERILDVRIEGRRVGDLTPDLNFPTTASDHERQQKVHEVVAIANVLRFCGVAAPDIQLRERPDAIVRTTGADLLIEHTDIFAGCQRDSSKLIQGYIHAALLKDGELKSKLAGRIVLVELHHTATNVSPIEAITSDCPGDHVSKTEAQRIAREIVNLTVDGSLARLPTNTRISISESQGVTLQKFHAQVTVGETVKGQEPGITIYTFRFKPGRTSLAYAMLRQLDIKKTQVSTYTDKPNWLVMSVNEISGPEFDYDLAQTSVSNIDPFEKVAVVIWRDWQPFISIWDRDSNGLRCAIPTVPSNDSEITEPDALHRWAYAVDKALEPYRIASMIRGENPTGLPHLFLAPGCAQWYQYWMGPYRWVSSWAVKERADMVKVAFWTNGDPNRAPSDQSTENTTDFAARVWEFLKPGSAGS